MEYWDTDMYRNTLGYKEHIPTNGVYIQLNETIMRLITRDKGQGQILIWGMFSRNIWSQKKQGGRTEENQEVNMDAHKTASKNQ